jgi:hypothetical protein
MSILQKIRLIGAIVLVCAIFLPLSECSRRDDKNLTSPRHTFAQQLFPQSNSDFEYSYAIGAMRFATWQGGVFSFVALLWPLLAFLFDKRIAGKRFGWSIYVLELALCYGTIYWLWIFTVLGHWLYGAYVVIAATGGFACATLVLLILSIRSLVLQRRALKISNQAP